MTEEQITQEELCNGAVPHEWQPIKDSDEEKCRWCGVYRQPVEE